MNNQNTKKRKQKRLALRFFTFVLALVTLLSFSGLRSVATTSTESIQASVTAFESSVSKVDKATISQEPDVQTSNASRPLSRAELKSLKLYPGGIPFGIKFMTEGVLIVGFCDLKSNNKKVNPSSDAGLKLGDRILSVDGITLDSAEELTRVVEKSEGKSLKIIYKRNGETKSTTLTPVFCQNEGAYKTGIYVKDSGAGIGTVSYINPKDLSFGGLGHGICEGDNAQLIPISKGSIVEVEINGVKKGACGAPGELKGYFTSGRIGALLTNNDCGVFGNFAKIPTGLPCDPLNIGLKEELTEGKAYIYTTLSGATPQKYEIEISNINRAETRGKCFTVKVTDKALLAKTGGIVQGMSGSPIIQNGKLIGAVTHVLINDPTTGYGIFIENMLNAANVPMQIAA